MRFLPSGGSDVDLDRVSNFRHGMHRLVSRTQLRPSHWRDFENAGARPQYRPGCGGNQDPVTAADVGLLHAHHRGMLPCFFTGRNTRLVISESSTAARQPRVSAGSMMSSTRRAPAETYGVAKVSRYSSINSWRRAS